MDFKTKYADGVLSNGKKVRVRILPAITEGIPVARRLFNLIAPAVGGTFDGLKHDEYLHGSPKTFTELSLVVCQQLEKAELGNLIATLFDKLEVEGKVVNIDDYFAANYDEMIEILEISLKENFSSFFTGSGMSQRFQKVISMIATGSIETMSSDE